jgi:hypothetical protein
VLTPDSPSGPFTTITETGSGTVSAGTTTTVRLHRDFGPHTCVGNRRSYPT